MKKGAIVILLTVVMCATSAWAGDANFSKVIEKANSGDAEAQYDVGLAYYWGEHGLTQDKTAACEYFEKSHLQKYARAESYFRDFCSKKERRLSNENVVGELKWGMTKDEVIAIERSPTENSITNSTLKYKKDVMGVPCVILYTFDGNSQELNKILYVFTPNDEKNAAQLFNEINSALSKKYSDENGTIRALSKAYYGDKVIEELLALIMEYSNKEPYIHVANMWKVEKRKAVVLRYTTIELAKMEKDKHEEEWQDALMRAEERRKEKEKDLSSF